MSELRCPKCLCKGPYPRSDDFSRIFSLSLAFGRVVITCLGCQFDGWSDLFDPSFQESQRGLTVTVATMSPSSRPPHRQHPDDAGFDLYSNETLTINVGAIKLVRCGIKLAIPPGVVGFICPRSGLALKRGVTVLNGPGVIDPGYRDEIGVILINLGDRNFEVAVGDRIAQIVFVETAALSLVTASELPPSTDRGGGFGSSGGLTTP